ncbi:MAG: amidohydrolase family protein [Haliscomenobacter sp.]|nr:amidohydrolase family protein [Haliscomenobacter sp.]
MYKIVFAVLCSAAIAGNAQDSLRMDFETYDPPSTLVVPEHQLTRARIPFIDVHSHHWNMAKQDLKKLIQEMDALHMGAIINLSGGGGAALKAMQDNINSQGYQNRIFLFTNISFNGIDEPDWAQNTVKQLEYDVANGAKGLKIFKSLGLSVKDKSGKRVPIDDPRIDPVWAKCGELGIPVLIHAGDPEPFWSPMDAQNERWLELKTHPGRRRSDTDPAPWAQIILEQHRVFRKHPKTRFINAHFGWFAHDLAKLGQLLDEMPNMYIELGAIIAELGRQPRQAKAFFEKYQDRILFGKDAYNPEEYHTYFRVLETADEYFPYYKRYHAFWRMYGLDLPDKVLERVYYKNALSLIPGLDPAVFR